MRIDIKRGRDACIITFHSKSFDSGYERSKFFKELHGWTQIVPRDERRYEYRRKGILDEVPHIKIADSVFMVASEHARRMEEFFKHWEEQVDYDIMEIMVRNHDIMRRLLDMEEI